MKKSSARKMTKFWIAVIFVIFFVFFTFPLLWVLSLSLKTPKELFYTPPHLLPDSFNLQNYTHALWNADIPRYLTNSFVLVFSTLIGTCLVVIPAAYAFSRIKFRGRTVMQFSLLCFQMISPLIISIPLYRYFSKLGLINNIFALIFVYLGLALPFGTWTMKGYFDTIPISIDEASAIDGASRLRTLVSVLMPLVVPGLISMIILVFVSSWSQFIVPFILLSDSRLFPISVGLVNMQSTADTVSTQLLSAASVISILPTIAIFTFFQKYIVSAMTAGAVKG